MFRTFCHCIVSRIELDKQVKPGRYVIIIVDSMLRVCSSGFIWLIYQLKKNVLRMSCAE